MSQVNPDRYGLTWTHKKSLSDLSATYPNMGVNNF